MSINSFSIQTILNNKKSLKSLKTVLESSNLKDVLTILLKSDILAVPVLDSSEKFIGFVDTLDITGFTLYEFKKRKTASDLLAHSCLDVINFSGTDASFVTKSTNSLLSLVEFFLTPLFIYPFQIQGSEEESMVQPRFPHRVAVVDNDYKVVDIITQYDLVCFLNKIYSKLDTSYLQERIGTFANLFHPIVSCRIDTSAMDVIEILFTNRIRGVAITNESGLIDGVFSANDLRGLKGDSFGYFDSSIAFFMAKGVACREKENRMYSVGFADTIGDCLKRMVSEHLVHLFIVDANSRAQGIVSATDLFAILFKGLLLYSLKDRDAHPDLEMIELLRWVLNLFLNSNLSSQELTL